MTRITTLRVSDPKTGNLKELRWMKCPAKRACSTVSDMLDECEFYVVLGSNEHCTFWECDRE